jgi:single-stranded-DNA-specific exonuclease
MQKLWQITKHDHDAVRGLSAELGVSPLLAALLIARGYADASSAARFLDPSLNDLHEPLLMKGMDAAVGRILRAIDSGEKILVWGDYDVDGTTGTVLLRKALQMIGGNAGYHVPNRFTEGYGLNQEALAAARDSGYTLAITVDCGIRSFEPLEWAATNGMDVIVTDHHLSDETRGNPPAYAVVNPNQPGCPYPDKNLAGVGVAFKLAHALLRERGRGQLVHHFLKIAAIGTVADVMNLIGENRAIVALGLKDLPSSKYPGLKALMEVADCTSRMTSYHIGFRIAPRINAAGRMDVARHVIELFECDDPLEARRLAQLLDRRNRERQRVQQEITESALLAAAGCGDRFVVIAGESWHKGVIGLAASRVAERLYRPTIVLSIEDGVAHGSARGIADFHLLEALESCPELFVQFGGHRAAAGMKLKPENIEPLREALNRHAAISIADEMLVPKLRIDALVRPETICLALVDELAKLEPFGAGNPRPVFTTRDLLVADEPRVMKEKHLKFRLDSRVGHCLEAVWWDGVERSMGRTPKAGDCIEVAYCLDANSYRGARCVQLIIEDVRPSGS